MEPCFEPGWVFVALVVCAIWKAASLKHSNGRLRETRGTYLRATNHCRLKPKATETWGSEGQKKEITWSGCKTVFMELLSSLLWKMNAFEAFGANHMKWVNLYLTSPCEGLHTANLNHCYMRAAAYTIYSCSTVIENYSVTGDLDVGNMLCSWYVGEKK